MKCSRIKVVLTRSDDPFVPLASRTANHFVMFTNHYWPLSDSVRRSPEFPFPGQHSFDAQVEVQFLPRETDSQDFESSPLFWNCRFQRRIPRKRSNNNTAI